MNKLYLTLLTLIFITAGSSSAQTLLLPLLEDSLHSYTYDIATAEVSTKQSRYFSYNSNDLLVKLLGVDINSDGDIAYSKNEFEYNSEELVSSIIYASNFSSLAGPWHDDLRRELEYDSQKRTLLKLDQVPAAGSGWENTLRTVFGYDDAAKVDSSTMEDWNSPTASWNSYDRTVNTYLPSGNIEKSVRRGWDEENLTWIELERFDYTYYPDGKQRTFLWTKNDGDFSSTFSDYLTYYPDGKLDSSLSRYELPEFNYVNNGLTTYHYDAQGRLVLLNNFSRNEATTIWAPTFNLIYVPGDGYYSNDPAHETQENMNVFSGNFEVWREVSRQYTPLGNGTVLYREEQTQLNNDGLAVTINLDSIWYRNATVETTSPLASGKADCQFANPFKSGNCIVCNSTDENSPIIIRIMNSSGQMVAQSLVMPGDSWRPGANIAAGSYFLTAWQKGKYLGQKKMIVR